MIWRFKNTNYSPKQGPIQGFNQTSPIGSHKFGPLTPSFSNPQLNLLTRPNFNKINCQGETQLKFNSSSFITKKGSGIKPKTMSRKSTSTTISLKHLYFVEYNTFFRYKLSQLQTPYVNYKHFKVALIVLFKWQMFHM